MKSKLLEHNTAFEGREVFGDYWAIGNSKRDQQILESKAGRGKG